MSVAAVTPATAHHAPVHDLAALKRGKLDPTEQRAAVSSQFEAILLRQFLQDSVGSMMGGKGADGGGGGVYGYMLTDTLAQKLSDSGGMGLAPMIAKQLTPRGTPVPAASATPASTP